MNKPRILIFGGLTPKWHRFIRVGPLFRTVLEWHGFDVELTENLDDLTPTNLGSYRVVVNYSTRREAEPQQIAALTQHIENGGGHVALHGASVTFEKTPEYFDLIGARFIQHPKQQNIHVKTVDPDHFITSGLPPTFEVFDEPYDLDVRGSFHLLLEGEAAGQTRPIAWVKEVGEGRVTYNSLGHDLEQWRHPLLQHLLVRSVQWAAGVEPTF